MTFRNEDKLAARGFTVYRVEQDDKTVSIWDPLTSGWAVHEQHRTKAACERWVRGKKSTLHISIGAKPRAHGVNGLEVVRVFASTKEDWVIKTAPTWTYREKLHAGKLPAVLSDMVMNPLMIIDEDPTRLFSLMSDDVRDAAIACVNDAAQALDLDQAARKTAKGAKGREGEKASCSSLTAQRPPAEAYRTVAYRTVAPAELEPHADALRYPTEPADRVFLYASLADRGQQQPLVVVDDGGLKILDGVGRWTFAREHGWAELDVRVVERCDPSAAVADANAAGRRRSIGSQILGYLQGRHQVVVEAYEEAKQSPNRSRDRFGKVAGKSVVGSLAPWTAEAIAKRLGVSDKDVRVACQMIRMLETGRGYSDGRGEYELTADDRARAEATYRAVLGGETPIRRALAAFAGKAVPAGESGRSAVKLDELAIRTLTSLKRVCAEWGGIAWQGADEGVATALWDESLTTLPEYARVALRGFIPETWSVPELKALRKAIDARLAAEKGGAR